MEQKSAVRNRTIEVLSISYRTDPVVHVEQYEKINTVGNRR
jgi:hypothetical protein